MIYALKGILTEKQPSFAVINVNGVFYEAYISLASYSALPAVSDEVQVYIHTSVRDDAISLFAFSSLEEKRLFLSLTSVSGIGPKLALKILGGVGIKELLQAIFSSDFNMLSSIPGIGKKTAQRIIVELRDKFKDASEISGSDLPSDSAKGDVISALINLGYKESEARKSIEKESSELGFEDLLKIALKSLGKN